METKQHIIETPIGPMVFIGNEQSIEQCYWIEADSIIEQSAEEAFWLKDLKAQLSSYFSGEINVFDLPLTPSGTDFQMQVWEELQNIAHGKTSTYLKLAQKFGNKNMSQAIGGAVGANPLLLLIPCHRVIGSDGSLTGFAGGLNRKAFLLRHEGAICGEQLELF